MSTQERLQRMHLEQFSSIAPSCTTMNRDQIINSSEMLTSSTQDAHTVEHKADEPNNTTQVPSKPTLCTLPPEIFLDLFDHLDPVTSTCLGLCNRNFYALHRAQHGTISLAAKSEGPDCRPLYQLLEDFFPGLYFAECICMYLTMPRFTVVMVKVVKDFDVRLREFRIELRSYRSTNE